MVTFMGSEHPKKRIKIRTGYVFVNFNKGIRYGRINFIEKHRQGNRKKVDSG